jgi:hypothetical protein
MRWIYLQEGRDWLKQKTTSQEKIVIDLGKERIEELVHQRDQGKSLNALIVTNQVTLKEIVDSP